MVHGPSIKSCLAGLGDVERPTLPRGNPIETGGIPHLLNMVGRRPLFNPRVSLVWAAIRQPQITAMQPGRGGRSELIERAACRLARTDRVQRRRAGQ